LIGYESIDDPSRAGKINDGYVGGVGSTNADPNVKVGSNPVAYPHSSKLSFKQQID